jgi:Arc/MetJ family transcription regulator
MRTLIDIDDKLMARAKKVLGTSTKRETVTRALEEVVAAELRRKHLEQLLENPDFTPGRFADLMKQAWR